MLKNNKGMTMSTLIITIVVMIILTGVSATSGFSAIREIRAGKVISNMTLVKAKVETIYEQYQFNADESVLVGEKTNSIIQLSDKEKSLFSSDIESWAWYKWDRAILQEQGLDINMVAEENCYYVNYENSEILYSLGTTIDGKTTYYSLTGLKYTFEND